MRAAVFTETFLPKMDGIVRVVCLLLDHLNKRGVETLLIAPKLGDIDYYNQTRVIQINGVSFPLYPELRLGPPTIGTYRELQAFQPDVVHVIHPVMIGIPGMIMAKTLGVPVLSSFHLDLARLASHYHLGFIRPLADYATKLVFNWADYTLAPSKQMQHELLAKGFSQVGLWKRGVDAQRFHPRFYDDAMRARLSAQHPQDIVLLYVGRLSAEKQIEHLRPVLAHVPNTRLALVGDGPHRQELEAYFAGTNTTFMGYLGGDELARAYASADIFTFPSAMESFGLVVVEAMAAGLPVVASRVGGIPDVVEEGYNGYTFNVGDVDALVEGVESIAVTRRRMQTMGRNARRFAETQSWDAMMEEVIVHYERLVYSYRHAKKIG